MQPLVNILGPYYDGILFGRGIGVTKKQLRINVGQLPLGLVERLEDRFDRVFDGKLTVRYEHPSRFSKTIYMMVETEGKVFNSLRTSLKNRELENGDPEEFVKGVIHSFVSKRRHQLLVQSQKHREMIKSVLGKHGVVFRENSSFLTIKTPKAPFFRELYNLYAKEEAKMKDMVIDEELTEILQERSVLKTAEKMKLTFTLDDSDLFRIITSPNTENHTKYRMFKEMVRRELELDTSFLQSLVEDNQDNSELVIEVLLELYKNEENGTLKEIQKITKPDIAEIVKFLLTAMLQNRKVETLREEILSSQKANGPSPSSTSQSTIEFFL